MPELPQKPDFFILVIIDKEFEAVKNMFSLKEPVFKKGRYYHPGTVTTKDGRNYSVVCHQIYDQGNISSAIAATAVLNNFEPKFLLVVGIAGGVDCREDELSLGDVVYSTRVDYYELKKEIGGKIKDRSIAMGDASPLLLGVCRNVRQLIEGKDLSESPPIKKSGHPKALPGIILSGEKLLADENSPRLKDILTEHDRALAVEMEGAGVSRAALEESTHCEAKFLDIRGISDFCNAGDNQKTRDSWRPYASLSAAFFAKTMIENAIISPDEKTPHEKYLAYLDNSIPREYSTPFNFKIKSDEKESDSENMYQYQKNFRKICLKGQAGSGKSEIVRRMAQSQVADGIVTVFVNLKVHGQDIKKGLSNSKELSTKEKIDVILKASIVPCNMEQIEKFERPFCLIIDGINEVSFGDLENPTPKTIIQALDDYVQSNSNASVVVTDRPTKRDFFDGWKEINILRIDDDEAKSVIDGKFGNDTYENLSSTTRQILGTAFFLNLSLKRKNPNMVSRGETMYDFLRDVTKLSDEELDNFSEFLFETSKVSQGLEFSIPTLSSEFENIAKKLQSSGILNGGNEESTLEHQLEHEYLFSRYLLNHSSEWNGNTFDLVTLNANSFEAINMAFEQITDRKLADSFLLKLYDWNLSATINAVKGNSGIGIDNYSQEIVAAILALANLKRFDKSFYTASYATETLECIDHPMMKELIKTKNLNDIIAITDQLTSSYDWFDVWKDLFKFDRTSSAPEETVNLIRAPISLLGWTASNVLKDCLLSEQNQLQLRTIYHASDSGNMIHNTRRWRVIHSLGSFPSEKNSELLLHALLTSNHYWVRYGAARSLIEMAAIADDTIRKQILVKLSGSLKDLDEGIWNEIRKTAFFKGALREWDKEILPILKQMQQLAPSRYREEWENYIKTFESGEWKTI